MKSCNRWIVSLLLLGALPVSLLACLWDYDTLKQERARFPSTLELITGKFLRHSPEFYRWRIEDRLKKLKADPNQLDYYDDLAVAYEKTGQHEKAIETILAKEKIKPGLYETYSNLGTFYILAGDFKKGLPFIEKALAINPDAHFGREKYQKWLVEYALMKLPDGKIGSPLLLKRGKVMLHLELRSFESYLRNQLGRKGPSTPLDELQKAVKAILGMMRFANHENPLLLEALGDLLSKGNPFADAKRLAAMAYLKASYVVNDEFLKNRYRTLATMALREQYADPTSKIVLSLNELESDFKKQLVEADRWYAGLRAKEISWIEKGLDPEKEFDALYNAEPTVETMGDHAGIEDPTRLETSYSDEPRSVETTDDKGRVESDDSASFFSLDNLLTDRKKQVASLALVVFAGLFLLMRYRISLHR